ncbi:MAG: DUF4136 domain-containing protein [Nitritalea sp.]
MPVSHFLLRCAIILLLFSSCASQKDFIAEYDFDYSGKFKRYKTFGFVENTHPDSLVFYQVIRNTITTRLNSQGFRFNPDKPDILVNYKLFTDQVKYRGYDQPHFDWWLQRRGLESLEEPDYLSEDTEKGFTPQEKDENYQRVRYVENPGLLVVFVIDNRRGQTVWQGYTAAAFDQRDETFTTDLTRATYRVMDQFRLITRN